MAHIAVLFSSPVCFQAIIQGEERAGFGGEKRQSKQDEKVMKLADLKDYSSRRLTVKAQAKMLIEKSRECHNLKPQPIPDTKTKRKRTEI